MCVSIGRRDAWRLCALLCYPGLALSFSKGPLVSPGECKMEIMTRHHKLFEFWSYKTCKFTPAEYFDTTAQESVSSLAVAKHQYLLQQ